MHPWIVFINLSAFILAVIVSSCDGAYDPALKEAAVNHLSRRCEDCGHYNCDCGCSSGGGYTSISYVDECCDPCYTSKTYIKDECCDPCYTSKTYVKDECCDPCYTGSSSRGISGGGGYVKVKSGGSAKKKSYSNDADCYEYKGKSSSRAGGGGEYVERYNGEQEYVKGSAGGYYEAEYGKGSYSGGQEYKSSSRKGEKGGLIKKSKSKGYSDC